MTHLIHKLSNLSWMYKNSLSFGLGALLALSQAPISFFPIIIVSCTGLLILSETETSPKLPLKQTFWIGWFFGLGYHGLGLYWIAFALGVDIKQFWWLVPFTILGLPAFFALWTGLVTLLTRLSGQKGLRRALLWAALWSLSEWGRGHAFTGFPWNLLGYTWLCSDEVLQITSIIGIYGLTALTVLLGCVPYGILKGKKRRATYFVVLLFIGIWGYGFLRLQHYPTQYNDAIMLRIVQPNIPQTLKWDVNRIRDNYAKLLKLSQSPSSHKITHVIWPESAIPFYLEEDAWRRHEIMNALPKGSTLITGGLRREIVKGLLIKIWNSLLVLNSSEEIAGTYDKFHLVPFGEYVPLRDWIPSLIQKVTHGTVDFSAGSGPRTLTISGTPPFSPLICYEGIFPGEVIGSHRPQWMVNVTNDAWYGRTSGPYQHFGSVRVRSIEEGIPLVRGANTGISGVFDSLGRVLQSLPLDAAGIIDENLPKPLEKPPLFTYLGNWGFFVIVFCILLWARPWRVSRHEVQSEDSNAKKGSSK